MMMSCWARGLFIVVLGVSLSECFSQQPPETAHSLKPPPLYSIEATSLYDAGSQHGKLAASRIRSWLATEEMKNLLDFIHGSGGAAFQNLKSINAKAYPHYAEEIQGIADGAGVGLDAIWATNLIMELETLMPKEKPPTHCSNFYSMHAPKTTDGFGHGHNEDWSYQAAEFYYYVKYTARTGANFSSCAGLSYPGVLIGWGPTWNEHAIYFSQNTLWPRKATSKGLGCVFAQREAICGPSGAQGMDAIITSLSSGSWSDGASLNLVDLKGRRQVNIERAVARHSVLEVTAAMANYSHFNLYKHSGNHSNLNIEPSSVHRQARANKLPPPRSIADVKALLSDTGDADYPIFRNETIASLVLDGSGHLDAWCCGNAPSKTKPTYSWDILHFFGKQEIWL